MCAVGILVVVCTMGRIGIVWDMGRTGFSLYTYAVSMYIIMFVHVVVPFFHPPSLSLSCWERSRIADRFA